MDRSRALAAHPVTLRLRGALRLAVDAILPPRCASCGETLAEPHGLCAQCWPNLAFISHPFCGVCGVPFEYEVGQRALCAGCIADPPEYTRARAAFIYDDASRPLILRFKHGDELHTAPTLGRLMARAGSTLLTDTDVIVPVPLHRTRLLARRYNQALELARVLGGALGDFSPPVVPDALIRKRRTPSQGHLSRAARARNVRGAFIIRADRRTSIAGKRVLLIDDVITTGATVRACARALLRAGAQTVDVLALARVECAPYIHF
ncbi:MAG: ComF family protein [Rhodospirillaceae bacterium]|nr:ComF family protein [Rhodospirillaceae bacterium]